MVHRAASRRHFLQLAAGASALPWVASCATAGPAGALEAGAPGETELRAVGQPMPRGYDVYNVPYSYRDRY